MDKLIPLLNEFQAIIAKSSFTSKIQFPQIVVIGNQSSGKSSLLETIIGEDFLPKGVGIVTRRPLIVQLFHQDKEKPIYAEFSHRKGETFSDFKQVREEIARDTDRVAGGEKAISSLPIVLKIYSHKVINLSLIDLPGIAKVPIGTQPKDIESQIVDLIKFYIENPNSLILTVLPANVDLANSDALKLAQSVDPNGERTIGVVSKLDLMDEGTNAVNLIQGKVFPLRLGYYGVVMRGEKDHQDGKDITYYKDKAQSFLEKHQVYNVVNDRIGVEKLVVHLSQILKLNIKRHLPSIRSKIYAHLQLCEEDMRGLGEAADGGLSTAHKKTLLLSVISKFCSQFKDLITGKNCISKSGEIFGGARINYVFNEVFRNKIHSINPFTVLTDQDIRITIRNSNGLNPSLLVSEAAFEMLVKDQINRLEAPSLECALLVHEELKKIIYQVTLIELKRFSHLEGQIKSIIESLLAKLIAPTNEMIRNLFEVERGYINTRHPDFIIGAKDSIGGDNRKQTFN